MRKKLLIRAVLPLVLGCMQDLIASQDVDSLEAAASDSEEDNEIVAEIEQFEFKDQADYESRMTILEARMNEVSTRTVHGNYGGKTATASAQISGENWFFTGDMLWWHLDEGGTDYAQLFTSTPGTSSSSDVKNRKLDFKWDFGFRAGIGTTFQHDKWDLYLNFTWFRTDNSAASSLHEHGLFLTPLAVADPIQASQVKVHWRVRFYDMALNLGRNYFISPKVALHPFVGVKTAWISQIKRSHSEVFSPFVGVLTSKDRNDFWGIGPDFGLEGKWFVVSGFNLFGSAAGALLWGDFDVRHKEFSPSMNAVRFNLNFDTHQVVPMAQFQLGIGYETNIYHNYYHIAVNARYEYQYWWQQNQIPFSTFFNNLRYLRSADDLSLQGITIDVRFDF